MIQRIQSVYLGLTPAITAGLLFYMPLFSSTNGPTMAGDDPLHLALFMGSALMAFLSLLSFKNRNRQIVLNRLNIIINFAHFGILIFMYWENKGIENFAPQLGAFIPILAVVFLALANKAILRDDAVIKGMDRLR